MTLLGVISDTHGLLRMEAVEALRGAEVIIHAGDIGKRQVITGLEALAPVIAVRGNLDGGEVAAAYPPVRKLTVEEVSILVIHDLKELPPLPPGEVQVVISGHTHSPRIFEKDGILYLNPGSAGRRRFKLPVTVALLKVCGSELSAEIIDLES